MRTALGPWYREQPVPHMTDEELIEAIDAARREGLEQFMSEALDHVNFCWSRFEIRDLFEREFDLDPLSIESKAVAVLQRESAEGYGDAAARIYDREYRHLWNEALDRGIADRANESGGWGD